jgi:hypothetical protein
MKLSKTIPIMKTILVITLASIVAACNTKPPMPKKPNESRRVPINKTIPIELEGVSLNDK